MYFQRSNLKRSSRYIKPSAILACAYLASIACSWDCLFAVESSQIAIVHYSDFGADEDKNGDGWPDAWKRVFDREHPKYIAVKTSNRDTINFVDLPQIRRSLAQWVLGVQQGRRPGDVVPEQIPIEIDRVLEHRLMNRCLQFEMDGGAVLIESSPFVIDRRFTYRLSAEMRCEQLKDFTAQISVVGIRQDRSELTLAKSTKLSGTSDWTPIRLNNILIEDQDLVSAKLKVEVKPTNFQALRGALSLDSVRVFRQPKLSVTLSPPSQVVRAGENVRALCEITGLNGADSAVQFLIRNVEGEVSQKLASPVETGATVDDDSEEDLNRFVGTCSMNMVFPAPGFYEVLVSLNESNRQAFNQVLHVAVLPEEELIVPGINGRFGLSIEGAGRSIKWPDTVRITNELCLGNVKVPIWFDASRGEEIDDLASALDMLTTKEIQPVAVLDRAPSSLLTKFPGDSGSVLLEALDQPAIWQPMLDPVLQRVALHVREFQIGWDNEVSNLHDNKLPGILQNVRTKLNAYEPEAKITLPCNITDKEVTSKATLINRYQLHAVPGLMPDEIDNYNQVLDKIADNRWISLAIADSTKYGCDSSIVDLTEKMLAVVESRFPVGYFSSNSAKDVFDEQGRPGVLYLPIRNVANWLRDCDNMEHISISPYHHAVLLFQNGKTNLLLFPAEGDYKPFRFWLGQDLKALDVWGRPVKLQVDDTASGAPILFPNNRWPVLIKDVNESLIRWQSAIDLASKDIVMTTTAAVPLSVQITNPDSVIATGTVKIVAPQMIREGSIDIRFNNASKEKKLASSEILLRSDVAEGELPLKMIVNVDSPGPFSFELDRFIHIGLPGVRISSKSQISKLGDLIIDVTIENQTSSPKSFDMLLFLPERPRERSQMIAVKDTQTRRIIVPHAEDLRNQTLRLSCEEIGTGRTINHLIHVSP